MIDRWLALATTIVLPCALRVLPLRTTLRLCDASAGWASGRETPQGMALRARRWLARGRGPWRPDCLTHAVVAYARLRQHGYPARLHIGVRGATGAFTAHAWVVVRGEVLSDAFAPREPFDEIFTHGC